MRVISQKIEGIPALIWGESSEKVCLCVHGKMSSKEAAEGIAQILALRGCQTISFDLPQHGERKAEDRRCDIWNGMHDLKIICEYVFGRWKEVSLYACSLGAYFSLNVCQNYPFRKCLFQSPIVDMEYLIRQMFLWFDISEERLEQEQEIDTPVDMMTWAYFQYVLSHPVSQWRIPTSILYAGRDNLQSSAVIHDFASRFGCEVTISENSEHPFMQETDFSIVNQWLHDHL
ncbi:MAG: alpha/beta hydrolase [Clostridia bacterium]|nr:alpha/beta hydrolase [Clostridia bacterium]